MSERLRHLQRQHTLLREHLAWIETEIAHESGHDMSSSSSPANAAATPPPVLPLPITARSATPAPFPEADALLEKYAPDERQNPADIRRGCFIVFASALSLLVAGVAALWLLFYR
jgi:hypothetical protein